MSVLPILYWIILILSALGLFAPASWPYGPRVNGVAAVVLFVIIGLRMFPQSFH